ncbi:MAG: LuxR C-terminal-related transcriptional regulator [Bradyrhizobium sp.]
MLPEMEVLSELIETIYDATLDRGLWQDALRKSSEFVGGSTSMIYWKDVARRAGQTILYWHPGPSGLQARYFGEYDRIDPISTTQFLFGIEELYSVEDCLPYHEYVETRVYKEYVTPNGWVDHLAATLDKSATCFTLFGIFRSRDQGLVDAEMRRRMRLIVPHVRRAVLIGNLLDLKTAEATALADTLHGLAAGVFLVDENGQIVFVNVSGQSMLDEGRILRRKNSMLTVTDQAAGAALSKIIASAGGGDASVGASGVAVPLTPPREEPWLAHILPLTSGARRKAGLAYSVVAAVFVRKASLETPSSLQTLSKLYKLTPSELRVLALISEVGGVPAVAGVLGISEPTVKTHLHHLFIKTGASNQAGLVKLIAGHASPLGG